MELADMQDLGSCAVRRVGSSPTIRMIGKEGSLQSEQNADISVWG